MMHLYLSTDVGVATRLNRDATDVENRLKARLGSEAETRESIIDRFAEEANAVVYDIDSEGTARVKVEGDILGSVPWHYALFGDKATSTYRLTTTMAELGQNEKVAKIIMEVDSPGGTIDGLSELAETIRAVRDVKPITAEVRGMAASAAYWIVSQATDIKVSKTAQGGSIGVFIAVLDVSQMAANVGIKVHKISTTEIKGTGLLGTELTEAQQEYLQQRVDSALQIFKADVAKGRDVSMSVVDKAATGGVFYGEEMITKQLADSLLSGNAFMSTQSDVQQSEETMGENTKETAKQDAPAVVDDEDKTVMTGNDTKQTDPLAKTRVAMLMEKHSAKIAPAKADQYREIGTALANAGKIDEFEAFLSELPDVDVKDAPTQIDMGQDPEHSAQSDARTAMAEMCGLSVEQMTKLSKIQRYAIANRKAYNKAGRPIAGVGPDMSNISERFQTENYRARSTSTALRMAKTIG